MPIRDSARRHGWLLGVLLFVVVAHLPYLVPGGPWSRLPEPLKLGQDEGTVLADSWRIDNGQVMYRDFFEFQGPIFYYLHAGVFKVTGPTIGAARVLHLLVTGIGAMLIALLVSRFAGRRAGVGAAFIHAFILLPEWPFAYPHWWAEAGVLAALAFLTREKPGPRDHVIAGVFLGLSLFTIQSVGLPVLFAVTVCLALPGLSRRDWRAALLPSLRLLLGAGIVALLVAVYFAAHGALGDLIWCMFVWPLKYYKLGQGSGTSYAWFFHESLAAHAPQGFPSTTLVHLGLEVVWVLPLFAVAAALVFAPWALWRLWKQREDFRDVLIAGAALAGVSPVWLAPIRPDLVHVAYLGSFGLLSAGILAAPFVSRWRLARAAVGGVMLLLGLVLLVGYANKTAQTWKASRAMGTWRDESLKLSGAANMDKTLPADATIVVGAVGGYYYLYVRPPAVPNTYIPATLPKYLAESQWQAIADAIYNRRPAGMIFVGSQWQEIQKRRPELGKLYQPGNGMLVPVPTTQPAP